MGNWSSSENGPQISEERVAQIQTETGFTSPQIDRLWKRFQELDREQRNYLTREDFLNLPDLGINPVSHTKMESKSLLYNLWNHG
jgi:Ca2+-binding EF-hand superfamily protein